MSTKTAWWLVLELEERMRVAGSYRAEGFVIPLTATGDVRLAVRSGVAESEVFVLANGREYPVLSHHFNGNHFVLYNNAACWPADDDEMRVEIDTGTAGALEVRVFFANLLTARWCEVDVLAAYAV
jgi:hypothetical protein